MGNGHSAAVEYHRHAAAHSIPQIVMAAAGVGEGNERLSRGQPRFLLRADRSGAYALFRRDKGRVGGHGVQHCRRARGDGAGTSAAEKEAEQMNRHTCTAGHGTGRTGKAYRYRTTHSIRRTKTIIQWIS